MIQVIKADFEGNEEEKNNSQKVVDKIDDYLISLNPVKDFSNTPDNAVNQLEKSFEFLCTSLEEVGVKDPKILTTFEFNSKIEFFEKKNKKSRG